MFGLRSNEREIIWLGFHASVFKTDLQKIPEADGWSTDLTVPIETALRKLAGFYGNIQTDGEFSTGFFAQSAGGGGGNGALSISGI